MIRVTLPLRIVSESNERGHWSKGAKRAKEQRGVTALRLGPRKVALAQEQEPGVWRLPDRLTVTLTRIATRKLDGDNLQRALKAVRDGVADALGIDDGDPRIEWRYEQRKQERGNASDALHVSWEGYGVEIRIEARTNAEAM